MKRKMSVRLLCLVIALVVLGGAVGYAAVMGSPYETLKKALLDAITYRNSTIEGEATITVDGVVLEIDKSHNIIGDNSSLGYYFDSEGNVNSYSYYSDGLTLYGSISYEDLDGTQWYSANVFPKDSANNQYGRSFGLMTPEDRDSAQMRFFELLADALVGDLKNNITMTTTDGIRVIRGTITESQVPELIKAGIDVLIEEQGRYYYDWRDVSFDGKEYITENISISDGMKTVTTWKQTVREMTDEEKEEYENGDYSRYVYSSSSITEYWGETYWEGIPYINVGEREQINRYTTPAVRSDFSNRQAYEIPMRSLVINYAHGEAQIDANGSLLSLSGNAAATLTNIFGDSTAIEINVSAHFTDIGTSNPICPIPGAEQVLTAENMKNLFGGSVERYTYVYFALNPDGSINADSITTTYPGEMDRSGYVTGNRNFLNAPPFPVTEVTYTVTETIITDDLES